MKSKRFYLDTEFIEGPVQRRFCGFRVGKPIDTIDLISIGLVTDDVNEHYYALNAEVDLKRVWRDEWLRENVLLPIYRERIFGDARLHYKFSYRTMRYLFQSQGKSKKQIETEVAKFLGCKWESNILPGGFDIGHWSRDKFTPEIYGYFADYDWVVFCWLFGRMIRLPKGLPMYCRDLKQYLDMSLQNEYNYLVFQGRLKSELPGIHSWEEYLEKLQATEGFPKPKGEHNALNDARFNKEFYHYIKNAYRVAALR
jgi:hypothetical protein